MKLQKQLKNINACGEAIDWVGERGIKAAWLECERADWMLWLLKRVEYQDKIAFVKIACGCAREVLKFVEEGEERPMIAIELAERWASGEKVSREDLRVAADAAAYAAYAAAADAAADAAAYAAADAAAYAAYAAAYADAYAADAVDAAAYAADAAADAAYAAAYAADAARLVMRKTQAAIVRDCITWEQVEIALNKYLEEKK